MGGSSTTQASIPSQYAGLAENTGQTATALQKYFWGGLTPKYYGRNPDGSPKLSDNTWDTGVGSSNEQPYTPYWANWPKTSNQGGGPRPYLPQGGDGTSTPPAGSPAGTPAGGPATPPIGTGPGGPGGTPLGASATSPQNTTGMGMQSPLGTVGALDNTGNLPGVFEPREEPVYDDDTLIDPQTGDPNFGTRVLNPNANFDIASIIQYQQPNTPGMSPFQQLVGQLIPALGSGTLDPNRAMPQGESNARQLAINNTSSAGQFSSTNGDEDIVRALQLNALNDPYNKELAPRPEGEGYVNDMAFGALGERNQSVNVGADDPWISAYKQNFEQNVSPLIQNQMQIRTGGGDRPGALGKALGEAFISTALTPAMQQSAQLQENRFGRQAQGLDQASNMLLETSGRETGRLESTAARRSNALQNATSSLLGIGSQAGQREQAAAEREQRGYETQIGTEMTLAERENQRLKDMISGFTEYGGFERGLATEENDAQNAERNRVQGLVEQSLYQSLGGFVPSTIGSKTSTGGMFK